MEHVSKDTAAKLRRGDERRAFLCELTSCDGECALACVASYGPVFDDLYLSS